MSRNLSERKEKPLILLTKFAEIRQEKPDTVRKYISRHKEEFAGHTLSKDNKMLLDEVAVDILNEIYPLPKPVEIIEDTESRRKLIQAQELIIQLQNKIIEQSDKLALYEAQKQLLEDKERKIQEEQARADSEHEYALIERARADEKQAELEKFEKTVFGFYRKKKEHKGK